MGEEESKIKLLKVHMGDGEALWRVKTESSQEFPSSQQHAPHAHLFLTLGVYNTTLS